MVWALGILAWWAIVSGVIMLLMSSRLTRWEVAYKQLWEDKEKQFGELQKAVTENSKRRAQLINHLERIESLAEQRALIARHCDAIETKLAELEAATNLQRHNERDTRGRFAPAGRS